MPDNLDLPALRAIAQAATQGEWLHAGTLVHTELSALVIASTDSSDLPAAVNECNAHHIATFSPPTVLALIARAEKAEEEVARLSKREDYAIRWANRSVDSVKEAWGETEAERDAWKARAEKAEAALVEAERSRDDALDQLGRTIINLPSAYRADGSAAGARRLRKDFEALSLAAERALEPFIAIRDQALCEMHHLILKASDGFTPISVTVTKAQFLEAHTLAQALRAPAKERTEG